MSKNAIDRPLNEPELEDDYPVYWDHLYVADGEVIRSDYQGTAWELRHKLKVQSLRRCDMRGRGLL